MLSASNCDTDDTFMYFAFGSNLLTDRIHINNPSAEFVDVAKLEDYKLDFNYKSARWHGAAATVVPSKGSHVWGVLWRLNVCDRPNLDTQEGVKVDASGEHVGVYRSMEVPVMRKSTGETVCARTYQLITPPEEDTRPSKVYLDVIKAGATEHSLPEEYLQFLESIEHNGYDREVDVKLCLSKTS